MEKFRNLEVESELDHDGDLWFHIFDEDGTAWTEYLNRADLVRLRDHLNGLVLTSASQIQENDKLFVFNCESSKILKTIDIEPDAD